MEYSNTFIRRFIVATLEGLLSSAREFHWSYTYTGALGDSSSCTCWHSIVYDLYLFVLDLCISW